MVKVLIPLVNGFEEIEAVSIIDILRRAQVEVVVAGVEQGSITGSHHITVDPDVSLSDLWTDEDAANQLVDRFDALVLPGGPGTRTLQTDPRVGQLIQAFTQQHRWVAAICAAPMVLAQQGILANKAATSYYSPQAYQQASAGTILLPLATGPIGHYRTDPVVVDGQIITSRGAGTAVEFALQLVANLVNPSLADQIATAIHSSWRAAATGSIASSYKA
jgi:4-methyl-5(b-hydroxyethyl)-thiazole monophosphate biosynthesis